MKPAEKLCPVVGQDDQQCQRLQSQLKKRLGERPYALWFADKARFETRGEQWTIAVGSPFLLTCIERQFLKELTEVARSCLGQAAFVRFEVDGSLSLGETTSKVDASADPASATPSICQQVSAAEAVAAKGQPRMPTPAREGDRSEGFSKSPSKSITATASTSSGVVQAVAAQASTATSRSRQRRLADLADFIPTPTAELAVTACQQVATHSGTPFNPLLLYGPVGTGKTHLLEGICRQLRRSQPHWNVVLLTAEAFANYFTQALTERSLPSFRQKFRGVDVLLVDDVDFFESKRVFQEEFLHTLCDLVDHGRQVVVSANRHPRLLTQLSDDLISRFQSGLICRLDTPDADTRLRIVEHKARRMEAEFAPEVLRFVAEHFKGGVRELEGALNCLQTVYGMTRRKITVNAARQILAELERDCLRVVRLADVERVVCQAFGIKAKELKSDSRVRTLAQPRMLAMFLARRHTQSAYSEIGQHFGGRNHSTVMSAEKKVAQWLEENATMRVASQSWTFQEIVANLEQQLLAG